ncbi:MAG TPA: hypothetical protein VFR81_24680 [Longimicrobium sp.]|nr:hypothetical protein [Longimicrobium sp.]
MTFHTMISRPAASAALAALLAACAGAAAGGGGPAAGPAPGGPSGGTAEAGRPSPDSIAAALQRATVPASPRQVRFAWSLDEAGARFSGSGVGRFHAPDRFRLDLFGPRGETYLAAALVGEEARIPPGLSERFVLPSPALLWAAVGVVRPPAGARLASATAEGDQVSLRYDIGAEGTLEYRARAGRLVSVRRLRGGGVQETVDLEHTETGVRSARYREWNALRNLNLTLESSTDVASFPEDAWTPPGTAR